MMEMSVYVLTRSTCSMLHAAAQLCLFRKTSFSHSTSVTINVHLCHRAELFYVPGLLYIELVLFNPFYTRWSLCVVPITEPNLYTCLSIVVQEQHRNLVLTRNDRVGSL